MKEEFFENIAKEEIIPGIENSIREEIDVMMEMEIRNLRFIQFKGKKDPMMKKMEKEKKKAEKVKLKANKEKLGFNFTFSAFFFSFSIFFIIGSFLPLN